MFSRYSTLPNFDSVLKIIQTRPIGKKLLSRHYHRLLIFQALVDLNIAFYYTLINICFHLFIRYLMTRRTVRLEVKQVNRREDYTQPR